MPKKLTLEIAQARVSSKFDYLELLEFVSTTALAKFLDKEYGEFEYIYESVYHGRANHPIRAAKRKDKRLSFDTASKNIKSKYDYLTLLTFDKTNAKAKFTDDMYGDFEAKYESVYYGNTGHKERSLANKIRAAKDPKRSVKAKTTNLKKYGVENVRQVTEFEQKAKDTNVERYGVENPATLQEFINKARATNIKNGNIKLINGKTLTQIAQDNDYSYSYIQQYVQHGNDIKNLQDKAEYQSLLELKLITLLAGINIDIKSGFKENIKIYDSRHHCKPDFVLNDKLIIECDGLYWHSDIFKEKNYHDKKLNIYKKSKLQALFFREEEINNHPNIVRSIILAKLNIIDNKVFARKCHIKEIRASESSEFFKTNHLMGKGAGKTYCLIYGDEIVSALRVINKTNHIEISRFCNKLDTRVLGGLGKLLKYVSKIYNKDIISFVDLRYGDGHSLKSLGFEEVSTHLSFKWTNFRQTFNRLSFKGSSGYNSGLFKIWDCGQKKFKLDIK